MKAGRTSPGIEWLLRGARDAWGRPCSPIAFDDLPHNRHVGRRIVWAVLNVIADHVDPAGDGAGPSRRTIGACALVHEWAVAEALGLLEGAGILEDTGRRTGQTGRVIVWRIAPDVWDPNRRQSVGESIGPPTGETVGQSVGQSVGESIGQSVGESVGNLSRDIEPELENPPTPLPGFGGADPDPVKPDEDSGERLELDTVRAILEANGAARRLVTRGKPAAVTGNVRPILTGHRKKPRSKPAPVELDPDPLTAALMGPIAVNGRRTVNTRPL